MTTPLILLVTLVYLGTAVAFWFEGKTGFSITFFGYSLANIGIIMEAMK